MSEEGFPMSDAELKEMDLRGRMTVIEQRVGIIFWLAICAELGVVALAVMVCLRAWRESS